MADRGGHSFLPGPSEVHPSVLAAMIQPEALEGVRSLTGQSQSLQALFRTSRDVILAPTSATGMMEAAIRGGVEERVLVVIGGSYGERFAQVALACGKEVVRAMVPPGRTLEAEHLVQFLDGPEVDAVALVHSESSTGSLTPLEELARVVRSRKDVHLLVDAAGSIGGSPVETDLWQLDFVFTCSEKALALPPGLALGVASDRLLARAAKLSGRGHCLDLVQLAQSPAGSTSALPQAAALAVQLDRIAAEGGIEARWKRHHEMLKLVEEWVLLHPEFSLLPAEGRRSWTVSCLRTPAGISGETIVQQMKERGWRIGAGWADLRDATIRIGHMGESTQEQLGDLLIALADIASVRPSRIV